jgi:hypothetical protein
LGINETHVKILYWVAKEKSLTQKQLLEKEKKIKLSFKDLCSQLIKLL